MRAIKTIAMREFTQTLRTPAFLLTTIIGLACLIVLSFLPTLISYVEHRSQTKIVVADQIGGMLPLIETALASIPANGRPDISFLPADTDSLDETALREKVTSGSIKAFLLISRPPAGHSEPLLTLGAKHPASGLIRSVEQVLRPIIISRRLSDMRMSPEQAARFEAPIITRVANLDNRFTSTNQLFTSQTLAYLLLFMLYMTLIGYGSVLTNGVAAEKGSRVMEMMLVSVKPTDLLGGKILGLGAASLLQYIVWVTAGLVVSWMHGAFDNLSVGGVKLELSAVPVSTILYFLLYYVLGYLAYSALYAAAGCLVNRPEESSQTVMPVVLLMVAAYFVAFTALNNPGGTLARYASMVPFLTPMVMFTRIVMSSVPLTEIVLSILFCLVFIWFAVAMGGRIYKHSVLRTRRAGWLEGLRGN